MFEQQYIYELWFFQLINHVKYFNKKSQRLTENADWSIIVNLLRLYMQ